MNRIIGLHIKEAASHLAAMRVWKNNAAIGKYVVQAAKELEAGKLKAKSGSRPGKHAPSKLN
jgi:hypothetical protein